MAGPNGLIMHASLRIGDSAFFLNDEFPGPQGSTGPATLGGTAVILNLEVEDSDKLYSQAVAAGAQSVMPLQDQFWGDRYGQGEDAYVHLWASATDRGEL